MNSKFKETIVDNLRIYDIPLTEGVMSAFKRAGSQLYQKAGKFTRGVEDYNQRVKRGAEGALANLLFGKEEGTFLNALENAARNCDKEFIWRDRVYPVPQKYIDRYNCPVGSNQPTKKRTQGTPPPSPPSSAPNTPKPANIGGPPKVPASPKVGGPPKVPTIPENVKTLPMKKFDSIIKKGAKAYITEQGPMETIPDPPPVAEPDPPIDSDLTPPEEIDDVNSVMAVGIKLIELARDALLYKGDIDPGAMSQLGSAITKDNVDDVEDIISNIVNINDSVDADPVVNYNKTT